MNSTSHKLLRELAPLQDAFNRKVNANWIYAGFPFHRAIWMEAGELVEGTNSWKWWKGHGSFDKAQLQLEVVDILHFLISWAMVDDHDDGESDWLGNLGSSLEEIDGWQIPVEFDVVKVIAAAEVVAGSSATRNLKHTIEAFAVLAHQCQLDTASMRKLYISKNALNTFRNLNGYKAGSYIKTWSGVEDNIVLGRIVDDLPGIGFDGLLRVLADFYQRYALTPEE